MTTYKSDKTKNKKYNEETIYAMSNNEMEYAVKEINIEYPMYNAFMAGAILNYFINNAYYDENNAAAGRLPDWFQLFGIVNPYTQ